MALGYTYKKPEIAIPVSSPPYSSTLDILLNPGRALARRSVATDLDVAAGSGYGHKVEKCPEGVPIEQALFAILAASAVAFGVLFRAVTQATMGRRRKRRSETAGQAVGARPILADLAWLGTRE